MSQPIPACCCREHDRSRNRTDGAKDACHADVPLGHSVLTHIASHSALCKSLSARGGVCKQMGWEASCLQGQNPLVHVLQTDTSDSIRASRCHGTVISFTMTLDLRFADSFQPGEGHEPASRWVGGPHDGMGPECRAEQARNAPKSGSNHKRIVVRHSCATAEQIWLQS